MENKAEAPKYFTQLDLPPCGVEDAVNVPIPVMVWNDDRTALVKKGERDQQKEIDAAAVGLGVYDLLRRAQHGDETGFDGVPLDGDFSDNPETLAEAKDLTDAADKVQEYLNNEQSRKVEQGIKPAPSSSSSGASPSDSMVKEKDQTEQSQEKSQESKKGESK